MEEVLLTALRDSRRNLIMLEEGMKELEAAVGREQMQFERLQFAYKKVDCFDLEALWRKEGRRSTQHQSNQNISWQSLMMIGVW